LVVTKKAWFMRFRICIRGYCEKILMTFQVLKKGREILYQNLDCQILKENCAPCSYKVISPYFVTTSQWSFLLKFGLRCIPLNSRFTHEELLTIIYSTERGYERRPSLCEVFRLERSETPGTESGSFSIAVGQLSPLGHSNIRRVAMTVPACRTVAASDKVRCHILRFNFGVKGNCSIF
jgi:hypothetical protein